MGKIIYASGVPASFLRPPSNMGNMVHFAQGRLLLFFLFRAFIALTATSGVVFANSALTPVQLRASVREWCADRTAAENLYGPISSWNISAVQDMANLFGPQCKNASFENATIENWDTNNVVNMAFMFDGTELFNRDISMWNVARVTNMTGMFKGAKSFNRPLGIWNVASVQDMKSMFQDAKSYTHDLSGWHVSSLTNAKYMFRGASSLNITLCWNISDSSVNIESMFLHTHKHNALRSDCTRCLSGQYRVDEDSCNSCQIGTFSPEPTGISTGASMCSPCLPGLYSGSIGASMCSPCSPGTSSAIRGAATCTQCDKGFFTASEGSESCDVCPRGNILDDSVGATTCDVCPVGSVSKKSGATSCRVCAQSEWCMGGATCRRGHAGSACGLCEKEWFLQYDFCKPCPCYGQYMAAVSFFFFLAVVGGLYHIVVGGFKFDDCCEIADNVGETADEVPQEAQDKIDKIKALQRWIITNLHISTNHFQVATIYFAIKMNYPLSFLRFVKILLNVFSLNIMQISSPECSTGALTYSERWAINVCLPIAMMAPFLFDKKTQQLAALIASITFIMGITACMEIWACTEDEDTGDSYLTVAPEVQCKAGNKEYDILLAFSILLFIVYFVVVQLLPKIFEWSLMGKGTPEKENSIMHNDEYREPYDSFWFLVVNMYKTITLIAALFLVTNVELQASLLMTFAFSYILIMMRFQPYKDTRDNILDIQLRVNEIMFVAIGLAHYRKDMNEEKAANTLFFLFSLSVFLTFGTLFSKYLCYEKVKDNCSEEVKKLFKEVENPDIARKKNFVTDIEIKHAYPYPEAFTRFFVEKLKGDPPKWLLRDGNQYDNINQYDIYIQLYKEKVPGTRMDELPDDSSSDKRGFSLDKLPQKPEHSTSSETSKPDSESDKKKKK